MPAGTYRTLTARESARRDLRPARRRRGRSDPRRSSWRGQPDHKARTCDRRLAIGAEERTRAIFAPDASAVSLYDLFRDRQPQSGILSKTLMRPVSVKALEDSLQRIVADPWAVIIDHDFDFRFHPAADDAHLAAGLGKRLGVDQQVGDHLSEPRIMSRYRERIGGAAAFEADFNGNLVAKAGFVGDRGQGVEQASKLDKRHILALQFGIEPACIGDVGS